MTELPGVLFLCTGNSCRSQMAEGFCRKLHSNLYHAASAGVENHGLNPRAVRAMAEAGIDISGNRSKTVDELDRDFDFVITVCDHAAETCPFFPAKTRLLHRGFDDPPSITAEMDDEEKIMAVYRRVRDEIRSFVEELPETLQGS